MNITEKAKSIADSCRFCWMCRHVCPIGNATGQERNTARGRALAVSLVARNAENIADVIDNIYECSLCGACTNNCLTGWDPKVFIQEVKTDAVMNGVIPEYILKLIDNYEKIGNAYGEVNANMKNGLPYGEKSDILFIAGQDATYKSPSSVIKAAELLKKAGVNFAMNEKADDTGSCMWFLTGKTGETVNAAKNCAEIINGYKKVIVYDPTDLRLIKHEYKEWGIDITAEVVSFNAFILELLENGKIKVAKTDAEYTLQDNYAYARDLDDTETGRKIIEKIGNNKEMLLNRKEANMAGSLLMREYMPEVMERVAQDRWVNAKNSDCKVLVTENPAEYEMLKSVCPDGYEVKSVEEAISDNLI